MANWSGLERLLARQHGVVARWQVNALGIAPDTFDRHVERHGWSRLRHSIYAAPWSPPSFARRCVVVRIAGPRARLITGGAELVLLEVRRQKPSAVDVWVGPGLAVASRPGVRLYRGAWVAGDKVRRIEHIPCTPELRALRDAAATSSTGRLVRDIAALDRLRRTTPDEAAAYLDRCGRFPGVRRLKAAVHAAQEGLVHSLDEDAARRHLSTAPFPLHPRPLAVRHGNRILGEVDIAVCGVRYGAEVDGPWHLLDGVAEHDRARDRRLGRLDWVIERYTDAEVRDDPAGFVAAVSSGVAAAAKRGVDPWPCPSCLR